MASQLVWKVYKDGEMVASTRFAEDAAAVVALTSHGVVRRDGRVVWREGLDGQAGESYDAAAELMHTRAQAHAKQRYERAWGRVP